MLWNTAHSEAVPGKDFSLARQARARVESAMTFDEFIRSKVLAGLDSKQQEAALAAMGYEASRPLEKDSFDGVVKQISHFVRNVKGIGVEESSKVERELLVRAGVTSTKIAKDFTVGNAVGVIATRGYLRAALVYLGFDWSRSMMIQSSCSELCRFAASYKNAVVRVRALHDCAEVAVSAPDLSHQVLDNAKPLLSALFDQAQEFQVRATKNGKEFVFTFELKNQQGNAA